MFKITLEETFSLNFAKILTEFVVNPNFVEKIDEN